MFKKVLALFTAVVLTAGLLTVTAEAAEKRGNTTGNINNKGIAAISGDWVYYGGGFSNSGIYKIKTDGTGKKKLNDKTPAYINVVGNWIYFTWISDGSGIYKIKTDGTRETLILEGSYDNVTVVGGWIYYRYLNNGKGSIYKIKTDGTGKKKLCGDDSWNVCVADGWIYYSNHGDDGKIYRIDTNGKNRKKICDLKDTSNISVYGKRVYFNSLQAGICSCPVDGGKVAYIRNSDGSCINVYDGWIYFTYGGALALYRIKTDGTNMGKLADGTSDFVNIAGKWIFFRQNNDYYRMNLDGSGKKPLK